jgi:hypothetical protein
LIGKSKINDLLAKELKRDQELFRLLWHEKNASRR